jgi:outer membrane receptor for monomeric catechols
MEASAGGWDAQGLKNIDELKRLTPGVTFSRNGSGTNYNDESSDINIRGIDSSAQRHDESMRDSLQRTATRVNLPSSASGFGG